MLPWSVEFNLDIRENGSHLKAPNTWVKSDRLDLGLYAESTFQNTLDDVRVPKSLPDGVSAGVNNIFASTTTSTHTTTQAKGKARRIGG